MFEQVGLDRIDAEDETADAEAMHEHHRAFGAALITGEPQRDRVCGVHGMNFGHGSPKRPFLTWWRVGIENAVTRKNASKGVKERSGEELAETGRGG